MSSALEFLLHKMKKNKNINEKSRSGSESRSETTEKWNKISLTAEGVFSERET